jgi:hypothetical protein
LPNTDYYVTVRSTNAQDTRFGYLPLSAAGDKAYWPDGARWTYVWTAAAAPFTEIATYLPFAGIVLSDITLEAQPLLSPEPPDFGIAFRPELYMPPLERQALLYASFFGPHNKEIRLGDRRMWQTYRRR